MDSDLVSNSIWSSFQQIEFLPFSMSIAVALLFLIVLLTMSALISGTEMAFFSLKPADIEHMRQLETTSSKNLLKHLTEPELLLATILIGNNFVNVAVVILASFISSSLIDFGNATILKFIFDVVIITALILFFCEIFPKIFASQFSRKFALFMSTPIRGLMKVLKPFSQLLIQSTGLVSRKLAKHHENISLDDLSHALELTGDDMAEEKEMLQGIVKFSNLSAEEIMTSRLDVVTLDAKSEYSKVLQVIIDSGYSRIPVYNESPDDIMGVLYVKDLLPYLDMEQGFNWHSLLREGYFVPGTKKINDLLAEFQTNKIHIAIVVDEYGGMAGIVTMEDVLEEIVGEISDEYDDDEAMHNIMSDGSIIFEGKIMLNDFFKITGIEPEEFDKVRGEAETLAGLLLEIKGEIPLKNEKLEYKSYSFVVLAADARRIKKVKYEKKAAPKTNKEK